MYATPPDGSPGPYRSARAAPCARGIPRRVLVSACLAVFPLLGCDDEEIVVGDPQGVVVGDFRTLADYLNDPAVQTILDFVPRHRGSDPPDIEGEYDVVGEIIANTVPGAEVGDVFEDFPFCVGSPSGSSLRVRILDPTVDTAGARSFIEGSGDAFTIYTAFESRDEAGGTTCLISEVVVLSGRREADGSLSDLYVGQGVVGLLGSCDPLIVDDIQIARTTGERTGDSCPPGDGTGDGETVELTVDNLLLEPIVVFLDYPDRFGPQPFVVFPDVEERSRPQNVPPGFTLSFESIQPSNFDPDGNEVLLGEIVAGTFTEDMTPPGETVTFVVENVIGDATYWAPSPVNETDEPIYAIVNTGVDFGATPFPAGSGLGCVCGIPPDPTVAADLGYHSYEVPGVITPSQTNVRIYSFVDDREFAGPGGEPLFTGPFDLETSSGLVILTVPASAAASLDGP